MIKTKIISKCINSHDRLHIAYNSYDNNVFITHCCKRPNEKVAVFEVDEILNFSNNEFKTILLNAYKTIPVNHDYNVYSYCNTENKFCLYNELELKFVAVDIFDYCNIRCPMCCVNHKPKISFDKMKMLYFHILNSLKGLNLNTIQLTGVGEPFLLKDETFEYISHLTSNDVKTIFIVTNATLLNDNDIFKLYNLSEQTGVKINIMVSCSAITNETYKKTHNNNNFEKVINNIIMLNKYNLLSSINFVIQKDNLHELDFYLDFWKSNNIDEQKCLANIIVEDGKPSKFIETSREYLDFFSKNRS